MKVLSLLQPWASLTLTIDPQTEKAFKQIETRSWNTKHRGELLIHASMGKKKEAALLMNSTICQKAFNKDYPLCIHTWLNDLPFGAIIGKVNLIDVISLDGVSGGDFSLSSVTRCTKEYYHTWDFNQQELAFGDYSPNRFGWLLSDPVLFKEPIPCKGQLGIWNFDVDHEINANEFLGNLESVELLKQLL